MSFVTNFAPALSPARRPRGPDTLRTVRPFVLALLCAWLAAACLPTEVLPPGECEVDCGPVDAGGSLPSPRGQVVIASFNVRLFFDTVCDSANCTSTSFEKVPSQASFEARAQEIADAIAALDADVVALQEIETQTALNAVLTRLPSFPHSEFGELGFPASVDVAVVSRLPITEVHRHQDRLLIRPDGSHTRFSRELLEVHLDVEGQRAVVFAAHFRSKSNDDPGRRYAEAVAARDIALEVAARTNPSLVVLAGDLNDVPGSPPLDVLEADGALVRASANDPPSEIGTYYYQGQWEAIDHLMVAPSAGGEAVADSFLVIRDSSGGYGGSDHSAVRASFLLPQQ